ncbi:MAG: VOC family protein [candidate division Zixibacteria bacterium]|nr:VOC family protein [candidate division Zixibacteria bacterium]
MPECHLDHLVITAPTLDAGCAYVEQQLGVRPQPGGQHPRMGTHNSLLRLADSIYLEVIAIDPDAREPSRPRWFGLDDLSLDASPRLATWVVRCDDIHEVVEKSPMSLGAIEPMSRGELEWLITIPADGELIMDGAGPTVIQWTTGQHPASRLADCGCRLSRLEIVHPDAVRLNTRLDAMGLVRNDLIDVFGQNGMRCLTAHVQTANGRRQLSGTGT